MGFEKSRKNIKARKETKSVDTLPEPTKKKYLGNILIEKKTKRGKRYFLHCFKV